MSETEYEKDDQSLTEEVGGKLDGKAIKNTSSADVIARQVNVQDSAVLRLQGETVTTNNTGIMMALIQQFEASNTGVGTLFADSVRLNESQAGLVVSRNVSGEKIQTKILIAGQIDGHVETLIDTPRSLLFGISAGVATGLVLTLFRLLDRKS